MEEVKKSKAFELIEFVWRNERVKSWMLLNPLLQDAVDIAIGLHLEFSENDFKDIYKNFNGGYWFGANGNGKGMGERFYIKACKVKNISAARSFEKWLGIKPFITEKGNRLYAGFECLLKDKRRYRVTGFDAEKGAVSFVSYDNYRGEGKRKLHSYDNKEWLSVRPEFTEI